MVIYKHQIPGKRVVNQQVFHKRKLFIERSARCYGRAFLLSILLSVAELKQARDKQVANCHLFTRTNYSSVLLQEFTEIALQFSLYHTLPHRKLIRIPVRKKGEISNLRYID
jgi:hypothetical protein